MQKENLKECLMSKLSWITSIKSEWNFIKKGRNISSRESRENWWNLKKNRDLSCKLLSKKFSSETLKELKFAKHSRKENTNDILTFLKLKQPK